MRFITTTNVYDVKVDEVPRRQGKEAFQFRVSFKNQRGVEANFGIVEYTNILVAVDPPDFSREALIIYAMRSLGLKEPHDVRNGKCFKWGEDNYKELLRTTEYSENELDREILKLVDRFFQVYPNQMLNETDLLNSVNAKVSSIRQRLRYLTNRGILKVGLASPKCYRREPDTFDKIEAFLGKSVDVELHGGYFKEVDLPPSFDEPYVFVLMPLRQEEFDQELYRKLIQPMVQEATGINCWRATDDQNRRLITDQIYTQIKKAKVCIAEISTLNPNVLIEVGIALALGKQVYLFHDTNTLSSNSIPFYLNKVPLDGYANREELKAKLKGVKIPK